MVPLALVGEPKAVTDQLGMLLQTLSEVEVEALPEVVVEEKAENSEDQNVGGSEEPVKSENSEKSEEPVKAEVKEEK